MEVQQADIPVHPVGDLEWPQMVIDIPECGGGQVDLAQVRPVQQQQPRLSFKVQIPLFNSFLQTDRHSWLCFFILRSAWKRFISRQISQNK